MISSTASFDNDNKKVFRKKIVVYRLIEVVCFILSVVSLFIMCKVLLEGLYVVALLVLCVSIVMAYFSTEVHSKVRDLIPENKEVVTDEEVGDCNKEITVEDTIEEAEEIGDENKTV